MASCILLPSLSPLCPPSLPPTLTHQHTHTQREVKCSANNLSNSLMCTNQLKRHGANRRGETEHEPSLAPGKNRWGNIGSWGGKGMLLFFFLFKKVTCVRSNICWSCLLLREFLSLLQSLKCKHPPPPLKTNSHLQDMPWSIPAAALWWQGNRDDCLMHALVLKQWQLLLLLRNVVTVYS